MQILNIKMQSLEVLENLKGMDLKTKAKNLCQDLNIEDFLSSEITLID
jgi:hypothetical protein